MKAANGGTPIATERKFGLEPQRVETLRRLRRELHEITSKSPRAVLGLAEDADATAARAAFLKLCKTSHPHAYAHFDSPEISTAATELFIAQKRAWTALSATCQAAQAQGTLNAPAQSPVRSAAVMQPASRHATTQNLWQQRSIPPQVISIPLAEDAPTARAQVSASLRPPISEEQRRGADAELAVAQALKLLAASRFDLAVKQLEAAHQSWPEHRDAELWLLVAKARKLKSEGLCDDANTAYRAVLALDPSHQESRKHIDEARAPGLPSRRSSKWFGRPED